MGDAKHDGLAVPGRVVLAHEPSFRIGKLEVDPATLQARNGDATETLEPRVMQALVALFRAGGIVTREELIARCWDGRIVSNDAINRVISRIRQIAAGLAEGSFRVETIARVGYKIVKSDQSSASGRPTPRPDRRQMILGGAAIAVAATGIGALWSGRPRSPGISNEARLLYDQAMAFAATGLPDDNRKAIANLEEAVRIAPAYADAWGTLALAYNAAIVSEAPERVEGFEVLRDAAIRRARQLDPENLDAIAAASLPVRYFGRWAEAESTYRSLMQRHAGLSYLNFQLGKVFMDVGRWGDAVAAISAAKASIPPSPVIAYALGVALWSSGDIAAAEAELDAAMLRWPQHHSIWQTKIKLLGLTGRPRAALALLSDVATRPIDEDRAMTELRTAFLTALATRAKADIDRAVALMAAANQAGPDGVTHAVNYAALGRTEQALTMLEDTLIDYADAVARGAGDGRMATHPLFQPHARSLWTTPRFAALLGRIGLERYWAQVKAVPDFRR